MIADARVNRRNHVRLFLISKANVTIERLIDDLFHGVAIVGRSFRTAVHLGARGPERFGVCR